MDIHMPINKYCNGIHYVRVNPYKSHLEICNLTINLHTEGGATADIIVLFIGRYTFSYHSACDSFSGLWETLAEILEKRTMRTFSFNFNSFLF